MEEKGKVGKIPQMQLQAIKQLGLWLPAATSGKPFGLHMHVHMDAFSSASTFKKGKAADTTLFRTKLSS